MNLHELVSELIIDTKGSPTASFWWPTADSSLGVFLPEIFLCATIVLILLFKMLRWTRGFDSAWIALAGAAGALYVLSPWQLFGDSETIQRMEIFTGMLVADGFSIFMRGVLIGFLVLFIPFTKLSGVPKNEDGPDIYVLILGATLGFCLMASANHLLMVFLAVEMASVPSYVLAGMIKGNRRGSEAALKYSVYGAGAAGIMLYGISLITGLANSAHLPTVAQNLEVQIPAMSSGQMTVLALALVLVMVGLAFKLSAVPFHFWCPDVFEGATAEIGGFLSVASKAAALALLVRVVLGLGTVPPTGVEPGAKTAAREQALLIDHDEAGLFRVSDEPSDKGDEATSLDEPTAIATAGATSSAGLERVRLLLGHLVAFLAAITCTFGNLAAYGQTNIKRLLAYSTIAHAGYMMMAVPAVMALAGVNPEAARFAVAAVGIYIVTYVFMNLGAFAIVAFLRNRMRSEQIDDYAGLLNRSPVVALCFSLILLGLIGLPPLSGFLGKFAVFAALVDAFSYTQQSYLIALVIIGGLNSAISLFYYLRIIKLMTMRPEQEGRPLFTIPLLSLPGAYVVLLTIPTAVLILFWDQLNHVVSAATRCLLVS